MDSMTSGRIVQLSGFGGKTLKGRAGNRASFAQNYTKRSGSSLPMAVTQDRISQRARQFCHWSDRDYGGLRRRSTRHDRQRFQFGFARSAAGAGLRGPSRPHPRSPACPEALWSERAGGEPAESFPNTTPARPRTIAMPNRRRERTLIAPRTALQCSMAPWRISSAGCTARRMPATTRFLSLKSRKSWCAEAIRCSITAGNIGPSEAPGQRFVWRGRPRPR